MAVDIQQATSAHIAVAAALAGVWAALPHIAQVAIQGQLAGWDNPVYPHESAEEHLTFLQGRLSAELDLVAQEALSAANIDPDVLPAIYAAVVKRVTDLYAG